MVAHNSWLLAASLMLGLAAQGWARCMEMEPEAIEKAVAKIAEEEMEESEEVKPTTRANFVGFKILEVIPKTEEDVAMLRKMEDAPDTDGIDFWVTPTAPDVPVTMAVRPDLVPLVEAVCEQYDLPVSVVADDLQNLIDAEMEEVLREEDDDGLNYRDPSKSYYDPSNYNRLRQIITHLDELQTQYGGSMSVSSIGSTDQGRQIKMATLRSGYGGNKAAVWLDCGIHAREWVSPAFCMHAIKQMLAEGENGPLKHFDFYVVPVANPDGYEYTWTTNRMWRKNRSSRGRSSAGAEEELAVEEVEVQTKQFWPGFQFPGFGGQQQQPSWPNQPAYPAQQPQRPIGGGGAKGCDGVDPNRNFDIGFASVGSSNICSKDTYHGPGAFSEAESRAIRDAVRSIKSRQRLVSFVSVHAYSQLWMLPYGYTKTRAGDYKDLMRVARTATNALQSAYGTSFKYGPINEVIYQAAGSSVDWAYAKENVKYSYALELRDTGRHGFLLPVSQIEPTVKETYAGLKAMAEEMAKEY